MIEAGVERPQVGLDHRLALLPEALADRGTQSFDRQVEHGREDTDGDDVAG